MPYFVDQVIERYTPLDETAKKFISSHYWSDQASVNLGDVCGSTHILYAGMTWRELLSKGQAMEENMATFRRNPAYYTDAEITRQPSMHYIRRDGKTWIGEDGNQRSCIGKLYLYHAEHAYIHRVCLNEYNVDWAYYDWYLRLRTMRQNWCFSVKQESVRRDDGPGWMRDFFKTNIKITDEQETWCWNREKVAEAVSVLETKDKKSFFAKFFRN